MIAVAHPFDWHLHLVWLLALLGLVAGYLWATRKPGCARRPRQKVLFFAGVVVLAGGPDLAPGRPGQPLAAAGAGPPAAVADPGRAPAPGARDAASRHRPPDPAGAVDAVLRVAVRPAPGRGHRHRGGRRHVDRRRRESGRALGDLSAARHRTARARIGLRVVGAGSDRVPRGAASLGARARAAI